MKTCPIVLKIMVFVLFSYVLFACAKANRESADFGGFGGESKAKTQDEESAVAFAPPPPPPPAPLDQTTPTPEVPTPQQTPQNKVRTTTDFATKDTLADIIVPPKKFVRTAELRGKAKNTLQATQAAEQITKKYAGFITSSTLANHLGYNTSVVVSADSVLHTQYITPQATLTLIVPYQYLDSALQNLVNLLEVVEEQKINAEDVSISLVEEKMRTTLNYQSKNRLQKAVNEGGDRLDRIVAAEEAMVSRQEAMVTAQIATLRIHDKVFFSTIQMQISQPEIIKQFATINKQQELKTVPFYYKFIEAWQTGWTSIQNLVLFIVEGWAVWLLLVGAWVGYKKIIKPWWVNRKKG